MLFWLMSGRSDSILTGYGWTSSRLFKSAIHENRLLSSILFVKAARSLSVAMSCFAIRSWSFPDSS